MYHSISEDPEMGISSYHRVCTSPTRFAEQMERLARTGWRGTSLREGLDLLKGNPVDDPRCVAITFDDGFRDFYSHAFPILQQHQFSATMYLPTAYISNSRLTFKSRECMTWTEVKELHRKRIEFGSHSVNHPVLHGLPWSEIESELSVSKAHIEQEIGEKVESFGYPYAFPQEDHVFVATVSDILQELGYQNSVTTVVGRAERSGAPFLLPRLPVNDCDDGELLAAKLEGAYDWMSVAQCWYRTLRRNVRRRPRREPRVRPASASVSNTQ
jgi:peptidoglycan/xylan/chitin deacetylase (PgdA/CDA1 family)